MLDLQKSVTCGVEETTRNVLDTAETWILLSYASDILAHVSRFSPKIPWTQEELETLVLPVKIPACRGHILTHPLGHPLKVHLHHKPSHTRHYHIRFPSIRFPHLSMHLLHKDTPHLSLKTTLHTRPPRRHSTQRMMYRINSLHRRRRAHLPYPMSSSQQATGRAHYFA